MKSIVWLYLKVFLILGLGFGALMSLNDLLFSKGFQWNQFLFRTFFFGGFMTLTLVTIHIISLRGKGVKEFTADVLKVTQKRSVQSALNKNQLIEKISKDPVFGKMKLSETDHEIEIRSTMSLASWGNLISIHVNVENGSLHHFEIASKPVLSTTLVDYGSNYGLVSRLEKLMLE